MTHGMIRMARKTPRPTKSRCSASAAAEAQHEGEERRGDRPDHRVEVTRQNTSLVRMAV